MITEEDKERVRQATDILALVGETVELRQRGADWWGCCPFHHEKSPSFHVNPSTGLWNCFGCHKGGDVFDYVMAREHLEFPDAIRYLADRAGLELVEERGTNHGPKRNRLMQTLAEAEAYYSLMLLRGRGEGPSSARHYLAGRSFGADICRRWHLGYAPGRASLASHLRQKGFGPQEIVACDLAQERLGRLQDRFFDRVMFPIHDEQGRSIGFGGRVLSDAKPKYLNTKETAVFHKSKHLFALDRAKAQITATGEALVVEGYTDVISLHEHGFTNAVAALGTALSAEHIKALSRFRTQQIVCMFDGDAAGQKAAELSVRYIDQTEAEMRCVVLPDNQDPMEFLSAHQPEELREIIDHARPLVEFVIEKKLAGYNLSVAGQRVRALSDVAKVLAPLKTSVSFDRYANDVALRLGTDVETTKRVIKQTSVNEQEQQVDEKKSVSPNNGHAFNPAAFDVLSLDDRKQLSAERELLSLLARSPAVVRPYGERLGKLSWADSRHETIAWAMLATPVSATPAEMVAAASRAEPTAPQILSRGGLVAAASMDDERKALFLVDVIELYSIRRGIKSIQVRLRGATSGGDASDEKSLYVEASKLQLQARQLEQKISSEV